MKRIAMFLDGTWNSPDDNTNVWRSKLLVAERDAAGNPQESYYEVGVGTKRFERLRGGALGKGLDANVRNAYQWLMSVYEEGDLIYLFGFSRGAYTARSLAGLINKCGLLYPGSMFSVPQLFDRYRKGDKVPARYNLAAGRPPRDQWSRDDAWLMEESQRVPIEFIGVWDTVGALGIPVGKLKFSLRGLNRKSYYFYSTNPSVLYKNMYQALAIDENRPQYRPALWTLFQPPSGPVPALGPGQKLEQRWFIGAHCNVGGGYRNDPLAQIPLAWLQEKAITAGLRFTRQITLSGDEHLTPPVDSYARFLRGGEYVLTLGRRHYRTIAGEPVPTKKIPGFSHSINEHIDETVFKRWQQVASYRPKNLEAWSKLHQLDPANIHSSWP
jgi:uncharacterized protein (DUF2235 family)